MGKKTKQTSYDFSGAEKKIDSRIGTIRQFYDYAKERGLNRDVIAGILGNAAVESDYTFSANAAQYGGGPGRGIIQIEQNTPRARLAKQVIKDSGGRWDNDMDQWKYIVDSVVDKSRGNTKENWASSWKQNTFLHGPFRADPKVKAELYSKWHLRPGTPHMERRHLAATYIDGKLQEFEQEDAKAADKEIRDNMWGADKFKQLPEVYGFLSKGHKNLLGKVQPQPRLEASNDVKEKNSIGRQSFLSMFEKGGKPKKISVSKHSAGGIFLNYRASPLETPNQPSNTPDLSESSDKYNVITKSDDTEVVDIPTTSRDGLVENLQKIYTDRNAYIIENSIFGETPNRSGKLSDTHFLSGTVTGPDQYERAWDEYLKNNPEHAEYRDILTRLAEIETRFRNIQNEAGADSYGYFQINKINLPGVDYQEFLNDPQAQIRKAIEVLQYNISTFTDEDWKKGEELGYGKLAMVAGAWLGGNKGVRDYIYRGIDADDRHHSKEGKGESISYRMNRFRLKEGGSIDTKEFPVKISGKTYTITLAETDEEKSTGLSKKDSLEDNKGMLFIISEDDKDEEGLIWFTMEDTKIPLDIVFIDDNFEVLQVTKGIPLSEEPVYGQGNYVLEVNPDSGIAVGDELEFKTNKKVNTKMLVLDSEGNSQMTLDGGERIFSIKNTKILVKFAKKSTATQKDNDFKALGKRVFKFLEVQDTNEPEYV